MTKRKEKGENEITEESNRRARIERRNVCEILDEMLKAAKAQNDTKRVKKIITAQKFLGCRNKRKERGS